ncbi:HSF-type DNA-binding-domain-containing protein [Pilobolus umbonatus]|nr:HSF-type DNA-binding-domain-containing protein [Pilobolus umbonatus]
MLEDSSIKNLISWSDKGDLFSVSNPTAFSKTVLPQYFKHNNWQSFVRQLNMYGFHKVNDMIHSNLTTDNQTWEFKHPNFRKGAIEDLQNIKRKNTKQFSPLPSRMSAISRPPGDNDDDIYGPMYKHILHIEDRLHQVSRSHEILKCETNSLRDLIVHQQKVIGNLASLLSDSLKDDGMYQNHIK